MSIINALGGIDNVRFLHRVLACVLLFQAVLHLIEIGLSILRRRFKPSMMITFQDFRDTFDMVRYSVGLIPNKPKLFKMPQVAPRSPCLNANGFSIFPRFCLAAGSKPLPALPFRLAQGLESVFTKSLCRTLR